MSNTPSDSPSDPSKAAPSEEASQSEPAWMIEPVAAPSHIKLALKGVLGTGEINPEMLRSLAHIAQEIQNSKQPMLLNWCPKLKECGTYLDDGSGCPSLLKCGNYSLQLL